MYVITFKAKFEEESGVGGIIIVVEVHTSNKNNNKYGQPKISAENAKKTPKIRYFHILHKNTLKIRKFEEKNVKGSDGREGMGSCA